MQCILIFFTNINTLDNSIFAPKPVNINKTFPPRLIPLPYICAAKTATLNRNFAWTIQGSHSRVKGT